jgi:excisionase family DNA binding protein
MPVATALDVHELPVIMTVEQVRRFLGLSREKTYALAHSSGFPALRFGRAFRVSRDALLRWLDEQARCHA